MGTRSSRESRASQYSLGRMSIWSDMICPSLRKDPADLFKPFAQEQMPQHRLPGQAPPRQQGQLPQDDAPDLKEPMKKVEQRMARTH